MILKIVWSSFSQINSLNESIIWNGKCTGKAQNERAVCTKGSAQANVPTIQCDEKNQGKSCQNSSILDCEKNDIGLRALHLFTGNHVHFRQLGEREKEDSVFALLKQIYFGSGTKSFFFFLKKILPLNKWILIGLKSCMLTKEEVNSHMSSLIKAV